MATINFITSETRVDLDSKLVELSRLFLWYKKDFIDSNKTENENEQLLKYV